MAKSTFGLRAVNDGKLLGRLREGKSLTLATAGRIREFMLENPPRTGGKTTTKRAGDSAMAVATARKPRAGARTEERSEGRPASRAASAKGGKSGTETPFRFYDNRQKYLSFINTCNEKSVIAKRAGREFQFIQPHPPAFRIFDAGMGDATVLSNCLRDLHQRFPTVPLVAVAKEISMEDVRIGLDKLVDRFCEHPATVVVLTNLNYAEAPRLMTGDVAAANAMNWQEVRLEGTCSLSWQEQLESLHDMFAEGWATAPSKVTGNPVFMRPSVVVIYRRDHQILLDSIIPRPGLQNWQYDFILASQPWRSKTSAAFKAERIVAPLVRSLAPGGRLLAIQSYGRDPALEIVHEIWPGENPFPVSRHDILREVKRALGREVRDYNLKEMSDAKSLITYKMHTLPSEIGSNRGIGTSTLFAAWNAAIYVNQIEEERLEEVIADGSYLKATAKVLNKHGGLWFNDETFVVSRVKC